MPIYRYRCLNGHEQEVYQTFKEAVDDPRPGCPSCPELMSRVPAPVSRPLGGDTPVYFRNRGAK